MAKFFNFFWKVFRDQRLILKLSSNLQTYPLFPNLPQWLWLALFEHHSKQELLPFPFHHCTKTRFDEFFFIINFSCMFSNLNLNCSDLINMRNLQEEVKNCSDFSLLEQIVLEISKILQILGLQPQISKVFSHSESEQFW